MFNYLDTSDSGSFMAAPAMGAGVGGEFARAEVPNAETRAALEEARSISRARFDLLEAEGLLDVFEA